MLLPSPPEFPLHDAALFLDLDGTLAAIELRPSMVAISDETTSTLGLLAEVMDGAVAIVSGRSVGDIDRLLQPFKFPLAAEHGTIVRDASGSIVSRAFSRECVARITKTAHKALNRHAGIVIEPKNGAVAIHYRACPQHASVCRAVAQHICGLVPNATCQTGKMVVEIVPKGVSKGCAIMQLLSTKPFKGRLPVFAGDDLTDESGFGVVDDCGGISIKVGLGLTRARWHLDGPEAVNAWLAGLVADVKPVRAES